MGVRVSTGEKLQDCTDQRGIQFVRQRRGRGQRQTTPILVSGSGHFRSRHEFALHHDRRRTLEVFLLPKTELSFLQVSVACIVERAQRASESESGTT